jgi:hypothetical protein
MSSIDREDTIQILKDLQKDHLQFCLIPFRQAIERVQALPSTDRPPGEWIDYRQYNIPLFDCSICGYHAKKMSNFCPNCGSKMKGVGKFIDMRGGGIIVKEDISELEALLREALK